MYTGILIFQSRLNTRGLSISGNAMAAISGAIIYAPVAQLAESGNGQLNDSLIVGTLSLSGNVVLTQTADESDNGGDLSTVADTLLAGDQYLYLNDPNSLFTPDMLARIQDAISGLDNLLAPYGVTISEVADPTFANLIIDIGSTSAAGTAAQGVLGCETATTTASEITILHDWNWYAGRDSTAIGSDQYDFETVVTHEIGHALGLGHNTNPNSVMYATLATGTIRRTMSAVDLNIPDTPDDRPDPLMATGFHSVPTPVAFPQNGFGTATGAPTGFSVVGLSALPSVGNPTEFAAQPGVPADVSVFSYVASNHSSGQPSVIVGQWSLASRQVGAETGSEGSFIVQEMEIATNPSRSQSSVASAQASSSRSLVVTRPRTGVVLDFALDQLALDLGMRGVGESVIDEAPAGAVASATLVRVDTDLPPDSSDGSTSKGRLSNILMAAGFVGFSAGLVAATKPKAKSPSAERSVRSFLRRLLWDENRDAINIDVDPHF